jgi:hypothetical protein
MNPYAVLVSLMAGWFILAWALWAEAARHAKTQDRLMHLVGVLQSFQQSRSTLDDGTYIHVNPETGEQLGVVDIRGGRSSVEDVEGTMAPNE